MRVIQAFWEYFSDLFEGDPVALTMTGVFVAFVAVVGLVAWRSRAEERRWRDRKNKKYGGGSDD